MKKIFLVTVSILFSFSVLFIACNEEAHSSESKEQTTTHAIPKDSLVKRGEYLVAIMGCNDCHTPKKMGPHGPELDNEKLLSGHPSSMPLGKINPKELASWVLFNHMQTAAVGPWGVSYAANITSDSTGIGAWTENQFFTAIRKGKYKGLEQSRPLLPPMPWATYAQASDEDLRAIFYYLKSTKPVKNIVPAPIPPDQIAKQ